MDDHELLREYIEHQSETAFAELVARHINLVYSTAVRMVREPHLAQDVAQTVFIGLARKPGTVREPRALAGWLYRTTRFVAANVLRSEHRRREREHDAMELNLAQPDPEALWKSFAPHLEEAMGTLNATDQDAVVLRFFEDKSLREVGEALGFTEDTAQKRLGRALEKLRRHFSRRGIGTSAALLGTVFAAHAVQAAPAGMASSIAAASVAGASGAGAIGLGGILEGLIMTKTKIAVVSAVVIGTAVVTPMAWHQWGPNSWQNRFEATYALRSGETLRYIPKPFIPERETYYRDSEKGRVNAPASPPDFYMFRQDGQGLRVGSRGYGHREHALEDILRTTCGLRRYEFEGPAELLALDLLGDWTVRRGASMESLLSALEPIVLKTTGRKVRFQKSLVEREVVVVRGRLANSWRNRLHIYADTAADTGGGGGGGTFTNLLADVGDRVQLRLINESQVDERSRFQYSYHRDIAIRGRDWRPELTDKVLRNLAAQTGLFFRRERRPVEVWLLTEQP